MKSWWAFMENVYTWHLGKMDEYMGIPVVYGIHKKLCKLFFSWHAKVLMRSQLVMACVGKDLVLWGCQCGRLQTLKRFDSAPTALLADVLSQRVVVGCANGHVELMKVKRSNTSDTTFTKFEPVRGYVQSIQAVWDDDLIVVAHQKYLSIYYVTEESNLIACIQQPDYVKQIVVGTLGRACDLQSKNEFCKASEDMQYDMSHICITNLLWQKFANWNRKDQTMPDNRLQHLDLYIVGLWNIMNVECWMICSYIIYFHITVLKDWLGFVKAQGICSIDLVQETTCWSSVLAWILGRWSQIFGISMCPRYKLRVVGIEKEVEWHWMSTGRSGESSQEMKRQLLHFSKD